MPIIDPDRLLEAVQESTFGMENIGFCIEWAWVHLSYRSIYPIWKE